MVDPLSIKTMSCTVNLLSASIHADQQVTLWRLLYSSGLHTACVCLGYS
jgi:hypothetical protein